MTETKKAFKDWDISDFDFAHAESLAHKPITAEGIARTMKIQRVHQMIRFIIHQFRLAKVRKTAQKSPRQSLEIGCRGRKYENSFRVLLLPSLESDAFADFGKHLRGDAEEGGNGIEWQVLYDAGITL